MIREYKDSIRVLAYILILTAINYLFPFLSLAVMLLWPVPIVYLVQKAETPRVILVIAAAAVLNGVFFGAFMGLITVIGFGMVGFIIGNVIKEDLSPLKTLIISVIAVIISQALVVYISANMVALNYQNLIQEAVNTIGAELEDQNLEQLIRAQMTYIRIVFPSLLAIAATVTGIFNYYLSAWYLRRRGLNIDLYKTVSSWYLPRWPISILIVISLLLRTEPVFLNLHVYLFFLAFLQGFGVLMYFLSYRNSSLVLKTFIIFLIFVFPPIFMVLILLGLIDLWFNLRNQSSQPG
ncbi:YybS family protein [Halanaerobium sp. Z-7514]|uniref:YybS family protein n=1 Tax=Halanaerobium polyolivorans TaxID=2886943 RepID=A0AAW4WUC3_9FIRM|nr:DUF2232 domain-containing protein [Halanaerobium polyolivorans]MCC3144703.1 YybS family protein [Halanaerobium polyolivorans]RQD76818.1 MAG: DUF2232 domain-containing protein [Halanaerobium sp. MSAO_Bac5]